MPSNININAIAIRKVSHISQQLQKDTKLETFHYYTAQPTVKFYTVEDVKNNSYQNFTIKADLIDTQVQYRCKEKETNLAIKHAL